MAFRKFGSGYPAHFENARLDVFKGRVYIVADVVTNGFTVNRIVKFRLADPEQVAIFVNEAFLQKKSLLDLMANEDTKLYVQEYVDADTREIAAGVTMTAKNDEGDECYLPGFSPDEVLANLQLYYKIRGR